jgi:hypothetical protein
VYLDEYGPSVIWQLCSHRDGWHRINDTSIIEKVADLRTVKGHVLYHGYLQIIFQCGMSGSGFWWNVRKWDGASIARYPFDHGQCSKSEIGEVLKRETDKALVAMADGGICVSG